MYKSFVVFSFGCLMATSAHAMQGKVKVRLSPIYSSYILKTGASVPVKVPAALVRQDRPISQASLQKVQQYAVHQRAEAVRRDQAAQGLLQLSCVK